MWGILRKHRTWGVIAVLVAVGLAVSVAAYLLTRRAVVLIERGLFDRVQLGMTAAEVAAVVPYPPGDHCGAYCFTTEAPVREGELPIAACGERFANGVTHCPHPMTGRRVHGWWWMGAEGVLMVYFGADGRVIERRYYPGYGESYLWYTAHRLLP